jgi:plasmid stabilization system protein ParE
VKASPEERDEIERAVLRANRLLREAPEQQGESRGGINRVMFEGRLVVRFRIVPGGIARVLRVRWAPRRS